MEGVGGNKQNFSKQPFSTGSDRMTLKKLSKRLHIFAEKRMRRCGVAPPTNNFRKT